MKTKLIILIVAPVFGAIMAIAAPMGTAFTYQGVATDNGLPATGLYDVQCLLYDAPTNGIQVGPTLNLPGSTTDNNGVFTVPLDFGAGAFTGQARWLEWRVRTNGSTAPYITLSPRQELTPAPAAIWANTAGNLVGSITTGQITGNFPTARLLGVLPNDLLSGTYSSAVTLNNAGNSLSGYFSGNGSGLNYVNADLLDGYHSSSFALLGSSPLFYDVAASRLNIGYNNTLSGSYATIPGGYQNQASGSYSFAAGYRAKATHTGTLVWADNTAADFSSTANNQFLIRAAGGVGINTNNPGGYALNVKGNIGASGVLWVGNGNTRLQGNALYVEGAITATGPIQSYGGLGVEGNAGCGGTFSVGSGLHFDYVLASVCDMWMASDGADELYMAVGQSGTGVDFTFRGDGQFRCRDCYETSDAKYKRSVVPLGQALDLVTKLRGVSFEWDDSRDPQQEVPAGRRIGLIAQEVEQVLPEVVHQDKDGIRSISYTKLVPVLIEAVKEQRQHTEQIVAEKETEIQALKQELTELKAVVSELVGQQKQGGK